MEINGGKLEEISREKDGCTGRKVGEGVHQMELCVSFGVTWLSGKTALHFS